MKYLLVALFLLLPSVTLLSSGATADRGQDESPRDRFETGAMADCRRCHRTRFDAFTAGRHGTGELGCLDCHSGAEEHVDSLGTIAAPHPHTYDLPRALALCTDCHAPGSEDFEELHRETVYVDRSCLDCHAFHEVTDALKGIPGARRSHGRAVPREISPPVGTAGGMTVTKGLVELGARGIDGGNNLFRTQTNLEPGMRLVHAAFAAENSDETAGLDHFDFDLTGVGDPVTRGRAEIGDRGNWDFRLNGLRHEYLFNPDTELADTFTVRAALGGEVEWYGDDGGSYVLGLERHERRQDTLYSRFRDVSNERFSPLVGDEVESAELLRFRADWMSGEWRLQSKSTLRRWRVSDSRNFVSPNALLDDSEDFASQSNALTASTSLFSERPVFDGRGLLDLEVFLAASERRFDADALAQGVDENGDAYEERLDAEGQAEGAYGRLEAGLAWELTDSLGASLRVRYRHDREESELDLLEERQIPPGDPPETTRTPERNQLTHRTFDVEAMLLTTPTGGLELDLGYGGRFEDLSIDDPYDVDSDPTSHGLLVEARAHPSDDFTLRGRARAFATDDPFTRLSPDRHALLSLDADWRASDLVSLNAGLSRSRTALGAAASHSDLDTAHVVVRLEAVDGEYGTRFGVTGREYDLKVDTTAQVSGFPVPYEARFAGTSYVWNGHVWWAPGVGTRLWSTLDLAHVLEDGASDLNTVVFGVEHALSSHLILRSSLAFWSFDGPAGEGDFRTRVFEVSIEYGM